ncbi:hypothetical protein [Aliamphritea spongicola]|nr:hypothetical protein [Aliamphritea spongicola]
MFDLNKFRHWVFDLDGTLTRPVHDFAHMRRELGIPEGEMILETIEQAPEPRKQQLLQRLDELEGHYARQAQPAEGVQDLIIRLHRAGCKLGILTRNKKISRSVPCRLSVWRSISTQMKCLAGMKPVPSRTLKGCRSSVSAGRLWGWAGNGRRLSV